MQRKVFFYCLALLLFVSMPARSAEPERSKPPVPEELSDAWERFQRALHDWGGRLWERVGPRGAREDRPVISQMLNNKDALGLSADQVRRLEQQRDNFQRLTIRNEADLRILELDIAALLRANRWTWPSSKRKCARKKSSAPTCASRASAPSNKARGYSMPSKRKNLASCSANR